VGGLAVEERIYERCLEESLAPQPGIEATVREHLSKEAARHRRIAAVERASAREEEPHGRGRHRVRAVDPWLA
jgi:hypothetical protein